MRLNFFPVIPFLHLVTLRLPPQNLPYSQKLFSHALLLYFLSGIVVLFPGTGDILNTILLMLLDLSMMFIFLKFVLYSQNQLARFAQTFYACLGSGVFFQLMALPLAIMLRGVDENVTGAAVAGGMVYLLLVGWQVAVMGHILRHAINMLFSLAVMLSFAYLITLIFLSNRLLGVLNSL